jgi:nucleotide-binding universal stress UspA family protein
MTAAVNRVLCPTDLSDVSARAFDYAVELARWYEARLTVLHVVPTLPLILGATADPPPPPPDQASLRRADLARFVADHGGEDRVEVVLAKGDPVHEIVARAAETSTDLMVVGTHGRHGLPGWLLGSVTEELLRRAPCPLLVVPPHAGGAPPPVPALLKHLLCPVDFSDASLRAAELAFSLAREADARVLLLHVVEAVPLPIPSLVPTAAGVVGYVHDLESAAAERLDRIVPADASEWCAVETRVVTGRPWREIVRAAAERATGLIVMGVHGHGPVDRLFFGSTATGVVRHAGCPVLVARPAVDSGRPASG